MKTRWICQSPLGGGADVAFHTRDRNYTSGAVRRRIEQIEASIPRYLEMVDTAALQGHELAEIRTTRITELITTQTGAKRRFAPLRHYYSFPSGP